MMLRLNSENSIFIEINNEDCEIHFNGTLFFNDIISEGIDVFVRMLKNALKNELNLSEEVSGISSRWWHEYMFEIYCIETGLKDENSRDISEPFWLWSTDKNFTLLYRQGDNLVFEFSPCCSDMFENEQFTEKEFRSWQKDFKLYGRVEVSLLQAEEIVEKLERLV